MPKANSKKRDRVRDEDFGPRIRRLRQRSSLTLEQLAARTGLAVSTIAKVETSQISPTYENILKLADGLNVDVTQLFTSASDQMAVGRRTVTFAGDGATYVSPHYTYQMLCGDIAQKQFVPLLTTIRARDVSEFSPLSRHAGEEFIFVISGEIDVLTEHYAPLRLSAGDSCYFDSMMAHGLISVGKHDAVVLWVCSRDTPPLTSGNAKTTLVRPEQSGRRLTLVAADRQHVKTKPRSQEGTARK